MPQLAKEDPPAGVETVLNAPQGAITLKNDTCRERGGKEWLVHLHRPAERRTQMATRAEILETLAHAQEHLLAHYQTLTPPELERPCTASALPDQLEESTYARYAAGDA